MFKTAQTQNIVGLFVKKKKKPLSVPPRFQRGTSLRDVTLTVPIILSKNQLPNANHNAYRRFSFSVSSFYFKPFHFQIINNESVTNKTPTQNLINGFLFPQNSSLPGGGDPIKP